MDEEALEHHVQQSLCTTRPQYRQGRKLTAVKVYTVNKESQHLMVYNVPKIGLEKELSAMCLKYGQLTTVSSAPPQYPRTEEFTDTFHVHYQLIKCARYAKKALDTKEFFGGILHVCYAPELETPDETFLKLCTRRKEVIYRQMLLKRTHTRVDNQGNSAFRQMYGLPAKRNCETLESSNSSETPDNQKVGPSPSQPSRESSSFFVPRVFAVKRPRR